MRPGSQEKNGALVRAALIEGKPGATKELLRLSRRLLVHRFAQGLKPEDFLAIEHDTWIDFKNGIARLSKSTNRQLWKAWHRRLAKYKKRRQRMLASYRKTQPFHNCFPTVYQSPRAQYPSQEETMIKNEILRQALDMTLDILTEAIPQLSERDQSIVVQLYRLEALFPDVDRNLPFASPGAERQARRRARVRLAKLIAEYLESWRPPESREALEAAQRIIAGGHRLSFSEALNAVTMEDTGGEDE